MKHFFLNIAEIFFLSFFSPLRVDVHQPKGIQVSLASDRFCLYFDECRNQCFNHHLISISFFFLGIAEYYYSFVQDFIGQIMSMSKFSQ